MKFGPLLIDSPLRQHAECRLAVLPTVHPGNTAGSTGTTEQCNGARAVACCLVFFTSFLLGRDDQSTNLHQVRILVYQISNRFSALLYVFSMPYVITAVRISVRSATTKVLTVSALIWRAYCFQCGSFAGRPIFKSPAFPVGRTQGPRSCGIQCSFLPSAYTSPRTVSQYR